MNDGIFQDWNVNAGNPKGRFVLAFLRLCRAIRRLPEPWWIVGLPILLLYVFLVEWFMGIELGYKVTIGTRIRLYHGTGLVVHPFAVIGDDCVLRHGVTIGDRGGSAVPTLGDRVEIGCGAMILGGITIGNDVRIGAGSVVLHDVPAGAVVVGNPAKVVRPSDS